MMILTARFGFPFISSNDLVSQDLFGFHSCLCTTFLFRACYCRHVHRLPSRARLQLVSLLELSRSKSMFSGYAFSRRSLNNRLIWCRNINRPMIFHLPLVLFAFLQLTNLCWLWMIPFDDLHVTNVALLGSVVIDYEPHWYCFVISNKSAENVRCLCDDRDSRWVYQLNYRTNEFAFAFHHSLLESVTFLGHLLPRSSFLPTVCYN